MVRQFQQENRTRQEKEGKHLTFTLANEDYCLEILKVRDAGARQDSLIFDLIKRLPRE